MHEMSICESIIQIIEDEARKQAFSRVKQVWLEIGLFSGIEADALRFSFDVVSRSSVAENAVLNIDELPGEGYCMNCGKTITVLQRFDPCPECGGYQVQVTGGDEMRIKELEVE